MNIRDLIDQNEIYLSTFIDEGVISQHEMASACGKFPSPLAEMSKDERYQMILNNLFHAVEELIEARQELKRRPWKVNESGCLDSDEKRKAFADEVFDIMLFLRAALAYAEISGKEFCEIAIAKLNHNKLRSDHIRK